MDKHIKSRIRNLLHSIPEICVIGLYHWDPKHGLLPSHV